MGRCVSAAVAQGRIAPGRAVPGRDRALRLLTAVENKPRDRAIIEALYGTGARVDELLQVRRRQLASDIHGRGGYVTHHGKHGGRTIRVGRRTWDALQLFAEGKEPDERWIVALPPSYVIDVSGFCV